MLTGEWVLHMLELRGITWNHTRGFLPVVASAQRFAELHPEVTIHWQKRSLQEFADYPLEKLVSDYDLIVIDHPAVGSVAENRLLVPLDECMPEGFLADLAKNSVGRSHESYFYAGHQWALAIDAAAPICGYRPDLFAQHGIALPRDWEELLELARAGFVAVAGVAIDSLCHFYMLCIGLGEEPFSSPDCLVSEDTGVRALEMLRQLLQLTVPGCAERNPIAVWELLTSTDTAALCPFAYGYSNYGRGAYCDRPLSFTGLVTSPAGLRFRSTLGGAGLAISAYCRDVTTAAAYCMFTASERCQCGLYYDSGGQPGHRKAWLNDRTNRESNYFFRNTLATLDEAWLRPRWNGYLQFQEQASHLLHEFVWKKGDPSRTLRELNLLLSRTRNEAAA